MVKNNNFAFYCEKSEALGIIERYFEPHEVCDTKEILFRQNDFAAIVVRKFSPYRERFLINRLWMKEVGIARRIIKYWNKEWPSCQSREHFESVRIEYVTSMFLFLIATYILSMSLLATEKCFWKKENKK